jgi:hypothetical protein
MLSPQKDERSAEMRQSQVQICRRHATFAQRSEVTVGSKHLKAMVLLPSLERTVNPKSGKSKRATDLVQIIGFVLQRLSPAIVENAPIASR